MSHVAHMDVCFLQRPVSNEHLQLVDLCKMVGVKVWLDYDDNLFCVPKSNPAHPFFNSEGTKNLMKQIIEKADIISVSTNHLKAEFLELFPDKEFRVIPNAFNDYLFKSVPKFVPHNVVMWRGTQSHQNDLLQFGAQILEASADNPNWLFNFMGYNPFFLTEKSPTRMLHTEPTEITQYHEVIRQTFPNLVIVTLTDNHFNRSKSNIAWLEGTYAGAATLAPLMDEWKKPGVITYKDIEDFGKTLKECLKSPDVLEQAHAISWEYIDANLRLSKVNHLRAQLLQELS